MARPTALSYEVVAAAAERLLASGIQPTVARLRAELGGSDATISPLLGRWKETRAMFGANGKTVAIPSNVDAVLRGWVDGCLAEQSQDHEGVLSAHKAQTAEATQVAEQRAIELEAAHASARSLEAALRVRDEQLIKVQADLNHAMSRLAESEHRGIELCGQLERARQQVAAAEQQAALAEQRAAIFEQMGLGAKLNTDGRRKGAGKPPERPPTGT